MMILRVLSLTILLSIVSTAVAQEQPSDPVADNAAVVVAGATRFTVLTPQLIRLEWSADGKFEDSPSLVVLNRRLPVPRFTRVVTDEAILISTDSLQLRYLRNGKRFSADNLEIRFMLNGVQRVWHPGMPDTANLKGTTRTLDGVEGSTTLEPGILSRDGWAIIDDSRRPLFDNSPWPWVTARPAGEREDLYFLGYGHEYRRALGDFTRIAGRIPMPPRFAFGTWWSRYWSYTDQEFKDLVRQFELHDVPLDVLVIDMDWHLTFDYRWDHHGTDQAGQMLGWTGYTWDRDYFPDPEGFLSWAHGRGLKTTVNIHPASGIQPHEDVYPEMAKAMGIDPETKKYVPFDITDKRFATNYMDLVMHRLQKQGVDFFWLDWQQWSKTTIPGVTPTFWLNYVFFTDMQREGKARPLLFHRWGGLGNHRYQIGFSGDAISVWPSLAFQPYFTSTAANVGFGYWSHDIGGHMPGAVSAELYTRWIQFGVFSPILRTHTTKNPDAERRIWAYPVDDFMRMRDAFVRRSTLIPYLYTEARRTNETGISLCHPLYYDYPEASEAYRFTNEYLFGSAMLVAPVVAPVARDSMLAAESIWLPPGTWFEWDTGTMLNGPAVVQRSYALDEIPVFLRAGSVIPMEEPMRHVGERPVDPLVVVIAPGDSGSTRLYEDDGNNEGYKRGEYTWTPISSSSELDGSRTVLIGPADGSYSGSLKGRAYEIHLLCSYPPEEVRVNGVGLPWVKDGGKEGWWYDGDRTTVLIRTTRFGVSQPVEIKVKMTANGHPSLSGLPGSIARMKRVIPLLESQWPKEWAPSSLVKCAQAGERMAIDPKSVDTEVAAFNAGRAAAIEAIQKMSVPDSIRVRAVNHLTAGE